MNHFIITRFNDYFPCLPDPNLGLDEKWLAARLKLLEDIAIPSIESQTDQDFLWILKCHPKTPMWAKKILNKKNFIVSYEKEVHNLITKQASISFAKIIRKSTRNKNIITTRLDSDDAISKDHIKLVKENIKSGMFYDFEKGIVKINNDYYLHSKNGTSQFCSYMERPDELRTVYCKIHPEISEAECIKNKTYFGWMQNHHDTNITIELKKGKVYPHRASNIDLKNLQKYYPSVFPKKSMFL